MVSSFAIMVYVISIFSLLDYFFLSYSGKGAMRISRYLTALIWRLCGLHITPTTLRKIIEIEFKQAEYESLLTEKDREALRNTLGHTNKTVNRFYLPTIR